MNILKNDLCSNHTKINPSYVYLVEILHHFSYTLQVHNLISQPATLQFTLIQYKYEVIVHKGIKNYNIHFAFMRIIPPKEVRGYITSNRARKNVYINNKPFDVVAPKYRNDVVKVIVSKNKGMSILKLYFCCATILY